MRRVASFGLLFILVVVAFVAVTTPSSIESKATAVSILSIGLIALSFLLERFKPFRRVWNVSRGDLRGDIGLFVGVFGVLDTALKLLASVIAIALFGDLSTSQINLPLAVEVVAVTLLIELTAWVAHWLHHTKPTLWKLHAMHHSTERLYTLNNFRFHPVNHIFNAVAVVFVPLLLGFSEESVLVYAAVSAPILVLQHANIDLEFGPLNRLINTNEVHRWHHSTETGHEKCNLGRALTIWDQLFGTYVEPSAADAPAGIGLTEYSKRRTPAANNTLGQLLFPFKSSDRQEVGTS